MPKLITCSDCGQKVSANARACPHCGSPQKRALDSAPRVMGRVVFMLGFLVLGGLALAHEAPMKYGEGIAAVLCLIMVIALSVLKR